MSARWRRRVEAEVITGAQIRAARKLLGWTRAELAVRAFGVSSHTIESAERERTRIAPMDAQLASIRRALEAAGVEFTNGDEPGVKLRGGQAGEMSAWKVLSRVEPRLNEAVGQ